MIFIIAPKYLIDILILIVHRMYLTRNPVLWPSRNMKQSPITQGKRIRASNRKYKGLIPLRGIQNF